MIESIILITAFLYLLITSILDIKYRMVWDYINYSFAFIFLILRLIQLLSGGSASLFISIITSSALTLVIGLILYKLGAWGGGDMKLLTGLCIGIYSFSADTYSKILGITVPFYANFLINTLFAGIIFGLIWSFFLAIKTKTYKEFNKFHKIIIIASLILIAASFFLNAKDKMLIYLVSTFSLYYVIKKFENKITLIDKKVSKLDEGDWIFSEIKVGKNIIAKKPTGLSKEDIKILQSSKMKTLKVKDGIPFLVSFFLAYIITLIINNNLMFLIVESLITNI